ncbi:hypothetical protein MFIFM68171_08539 [Madurella fahalii]|uniref:Uncharacterized protein n=1 Tax=Madurella fahalii TaxID=1157608 RepID=A0ABQ0GKU8_9PEZI
MSSQPLNVDTSGEGASANRSTYWNPNGANGEAANGGHGTAGSIKIGARHNVSGGTLNATGKGGAAVSNWAGTATGGNGTGGNVTLE